MPINCCFLVFSSFFFSFLKPRASNFEHKCKYRVRSFRFFFQFLFLLPFIMNSFFFFIRSVYTVLNYLNLFFFLQRSHTFCHSSSSTFRRLASCGCELVCTNCALVGRHIAFDFIISCSLMRDCVYFRMLYRWQEVVLYALYVDGWRGYVNDLDECSTLKFIDYYSVPKFRIRQTRGILSFLNFMGVVSFPWNFPRRIFIHSKWFEYSHVL